MEVSEATHNFYRSGMRDNISSSWESSIIGAVGRSESVVGPL